VSGAKLDDAHQDSHQERHQSSGYRRIELITGEARRRPWSAEEKSRILAESFQPGAKVADVARRHGMNRSLLWNWRPEARKRGADGERTFVPIRVMDTVDEVPSCDALEAPATAGCGPVSGGMAVRERSPARSRSRWEGRACASAVWLIRRRCSLPSRPQPTTHRAPS
jgi:transposase